MSDAIAPDLPTRRDRPWRISPAFERAKVAREPKPAIESKPESKPNPVIDRRPFEPVEIFSYPDLVLALRHRLDHLGITQETVDEIAGLTRGHSSKLL